MDKRVEPSAKGTLVLGVVVAAKRHREKGRISETELEIRLSPQAHALIDQKIMIAAWYPIRAFCELMDLNWDLGGGRAPEFMRREGERSADRLFDSGIYPQMRFAEEARRAQTRDDLLRHSRLISSVTGSLYNFLEIDVREREGDLEIVYGNASEFSEALRYSTEGFMNQINKRQKSVRRWTSERTTQDQVVFRMPVPGRLR